MVIVLFAEYGSDIFCAPCAKKKRTRLCEFISRLAHPFASINNIFFLRNVPTLIGVGITVA